MRVMTAMLLTLMAVTKGHSMEANNALRLVQAWGADSKDMTFIGRMVVDPRGGFATKASGAFLRFDAASRKLWVSGLVVYDIKIHSKHPETWQELLRAGQREHAAIGEGSFELYKQALFEFEPDVVLLTKQFESDDIDPAQFAREVRWLLSAATYWRMKRYSDVTVKPESDLMREAPGINERWPKRPW